MKDKRLEKLTKQLDKNNIKYTLKEVKEPLNCEMQGIIPSIEERLRNCMSILTLQKKDLQARIDKAIEYINSDEMLKLREEFEYCNDKDLFDDFAGHLDKILRGDKE